MPGVHAYRADVFEDGAQDVVLKNTRVLAIAVPNGGARVVSFGTYVHDPRDANRVLYENIFDATGALRDDVTVQPPASTTDRIAKFTHLYPAGTFNRPYSACTFENARGAGAYFAYDAPDVVPSGALFERVVALGAGADRLVVDERFTPHGTDAAQRLVSLSAIVTGRGPTSGQETFDPAAGGLTIDPPQDGGSGGTGRRVVSVAWRAGRRGSGVVDERARKPHGAARPRAGGLAARDLCIGVRRNGRRRAAVLRGGARVGGREPTPGERKRGSGETVYAVASKATE